MHHMTLVSFRLLRKNLGNLPEFLGEWFTAPPGKKLPVRLWLVLSPCEQLGTNNQTDQINNNCYDKTDRSD